MLPGPYHIQDHGWWGDYPGVPWMLPVETVAFPDELLLQENSIHERLGAAAARSLFRNNNVDMERG